MQGPGRIEQILGQKLLIAFAGKDQLPPDLLAAIQQYRPAGITLFRHLNIENPGQVRRLTGLLQQAARQSGLPGLLIAADQEGGQLMAVGEGVTLLPGNMALGAAGSPDLARRAGQVLGRELAAMGINIDYAPCCDVNMNPQNPVIGIRSFGEDPSQVAEYSAAMIAGIQSSGVAATAKHFPGHGDTASDSHLSVPVLLHSRERLQEVEFPPFRAAIQAGVRMLMTGHLAVPALDAEENLPATLSPAILKGLLRQELGFSGVIVTDAMDMGAIHQGAGLGEDAVRAVNAGDDLLLLTSEPESQRQVFTSLLQAARDGRLEMEDLRASLGRIAALKHWLASQPAQPDLSVVGCAEHQAVAGEIAARSITLVRDQSQLLPLRLQPGGSVAVILPRPSDLTLADTSSYVQPTLAQELRHYLPRVDEYILPTFPQEADISAILQQVQQYNLLMVGTLNAHANPAQAALVRAVLQSGIPSVVVALRLPYDLMAFSDAPVYVCTYSLLAPSMKALARALCGQSGFKGHLPVSIPGLYKIGYGLSL